MSVRKKILFISSWYPTTKMPFNGDFVKRLSEALGQYEDVTVLHIAQGAEYRVERNVVNDINEIIYYYPSKGIPLITKLLRYFKAIKTINKQGSNFDIIHGNVIYPIGIYVYLLSKILRIPYLFTEHWTGYLKEDKRKLNFLQLWMVRFIAKRSEIIVPVSHLLEDAMIECKIRGNYTVIPNLVDSNKFVVSEVKQSMPIKFLHVSNLEDNHKNFSGIVKAVHLLRAQRNDFLLQVVHNQDNNDVRDLVEQLKLSDCIAFLGAKPHEELSGIISTASFVVMFSNFETQGCVVLESLMSGVPVITTKVGGIEQFVNDKNGIFVEIGDIQALSDALDYMLNHAHDFNKAAIRESVISYVSPQSVALSYVNIYDSII